MIPVSAARIDGDRFLVCNYSAVQEVNVRTGAVRPVTPSADVTGWCPTGLCVWGENGTVFVANYTSHDVLEMRLAEDRLELVRRYTHPTMVSPENVDVSPDGRLVAVADYDGDSVLLFRRDGELAWSQPVGYAHGVAFGPDGVVATGLRDRTVTLFSLDGEVRRRVGSFGFGAGKYLWPTSIAFADDRYYVSDAHTGRVTVLDRDLKLVDWFGGNGPGAARFNMPYGVTIMGAELLVCDTFKNRLLRLERNGLCHAVVARGHQPLQWDVPAPPRERREHGYLDPLRRATMTLPVLGPTTWTPGYWGFQVDTELERRVTFRFPSPGTLLNPWRFPYLCWCVRVEHAGRRYLLLGHSEGPYCLIVDERGRCDCAETSDCLWCVEGRLYTNGGVVFNPTAILDEAARRFGEHDRLLSEQVDPLTAAARVFFPNLSPDELRSRIEAEFVSRAGKDFWKRWSDAAATPEEKAAALRFFDGVLKHEGNVLMQEMFLRNLLAGAP
jgi:DNA-binding beta-propeller fold protein YncE